MELSDGVCRTHTATTMTTTTKPTTTPTSKPTTTGSGTTPTETGTVPQYGTCGGTGYSGPTVCQAPYTCVVHSPYYSECQ
jgi:hypothetical protein